MFCTYCNQYMDESDGCKGGIQPVSVTIRVARRDLHRCNACDVVPGAYHHPGCPVERCPRCKHQLISCDCIYAVNGVDPASLDETDPVYSDGPTEAMYQVWEREWGTKRLRWTGVTPGVVEAEACGFWCRDLYPDGTPAPEAVPISKTQGIRFHVPCGPDDPGAKADLNRWYAAGCPDPFE